jgi:sulfur carrier protein ThiS
VPQIIIPPPYQGPTHGVARVEVQGRTLRLCLEAVEERHPGFLAQVIDPAGKVHRFVRLFRNGEQLSSEDLDSALESADELEIVAAIAGG